MKKSLLSSALIASFTLSTSLSLSASEEIGSVDIKRIQTPDVVETSIGTLKFIDGAPLPETAQKAYDYLDTMRGVDAFLKGIPAASIQGMMEGPNVLGRKTSNQVVIFDKLGCKFTLPNNQYINHVCLWHARLKSRWPHCG